MDAVCLISSFALLPPAESKGTVQDGALCVGHPDLWVCAGRQRVTHADRCGVAQLQRSGDVKQITNRCSTELSRIDGASAQRRMPPEAIFDQKVAGLRNCVPQQGPAA